MFNNFRMYIGIRFLIVMLLASNIFAQYQFPPKCDQIAEMKTTIRNYINANPQQIPKIIRMGK